MTLNELMQDIIALEEDLLMYERKYGIPSEIFYESFSQGDEPPDDAWVLDWGGWAATYQILQRRRQGFTAQIQVLQQQTSLIAVIEKVARRESIPLSA